MSRVDCPSCYGNGCLACDGRGWVESAEDREQREIDDGDQADRERDRRLVEGD